MTIQQWIQYLPYGTLIEYENETYRFTGIRTNEYLSFSISIWNKAKGNIWVVPDKCKPILRPLSYLSIPLGKEDLDQLGIIVGQKKDPISISTNKEQDGLWITYIHGGHTKPEWIVIRDLESFLVYINGEISSITPVKEFLLSRAYAIGIPKDHFIDVTTN